MKAVKIVQVDTAAIQPLRALYLQEQNCQIRYDACHTRGWADAYHVQVGDSIVGYGATKCLNSTRDRDTLFEFYLCPAYRAWTVASARALVEHASLSWIECQSQDSELARLVLEFSSRITSDTILFADHHTTSIAFPNALVRLRSEGDQIFEHEMEPVGDFVMELHGDIVATGGFMLYYNMPFSDVYMEVRRDQRRRGIGAYFVQELKRLSYEAGRVPAARCGRTNRASLATLLRAGFSVSGHILCGEIDKELLHLAVGP